MRVDAAIAANAALGLMEPTGQRYRWRSFRHCLGCRKAGAGRAECLRPCAEGDDAGVLSESRGIGEIPPFGPLPVSVPGAVDGWFEMHNRYGRLAMQDVLAPAIAYAQDGFPVSEVIAHYFSSDETRIGDYPGFNDTFMPNGDVPRKGEMFKNPRLAKTYQLIAEKGRDEFYKGSIAKRIDAFMAEQGGLLNL